jgi:MoxR-like ATPase
VESQGTYPLPEAQLDRFLLKLEVDYPDAETEQALLAAYVGGFDPQRLELRTVLELPQLLAMQELLSSVEVAPDILDYVTRLVRATRDHRSIDLGASPRASVGLLVAARAAAAVDGRGYVIPDDVKGLAHAVLRHRIVLHPDAELEGLARDEVIDTLLAETRVPGGVV